MVRFTRCFPHAMGSPPHRGSRGGDVAITSPFFCLADLLCYELQPAGRLLPFCLTSHLGSESSLRRHNRFRHRHLFQNSPDNVATHGFDTTISAA
jgi:hypothetical protein